MTEFLLDNCNIPVNCVNEYGFTPLHEASDDFGERAWHEPVSKYRKVAKILLDHGVDCSIKDNSGKTALDYAREWNRSDLYKLLEYYGKKQHK